MRQQWIDLFDVPLRYSVFVVIHTTYHSFIDFRIFYIFKIDEFRQVVVTTVFMNKSKLRITWIESNQTIRTLNRIFGFFFGRL